MVEEVVELLGGRDTVIDMTLGAGGHAEALLRSGCKLVVGVDRDPEAIALARSRLAPFGDRFVAVHARFSEVPRGIGRTASCSTSASQRCSWSEPNEGSATGFPVRW